MKWSYFLILSSALALTACQTNPSKPYVADTSRSYAKNVMLAGGIGGDLRDVSWQDAKQAREKALAKGAVDSGESSLVGAGAFGVVNYLSPPPGFSMTGAGLMGALSWMAVGFADPSAFPRVIAWMPKSMAGSPDEARDSLDQLISDALAKTAAGFPLPEGYSFAGMSRIPPGPGSKWGAPFIAVKGGKCDQPLHTCGFGIGVMVPFERAAPDFLGGQDSFAFTQSGDLKDARTGWIWQSCRKMSSDKPYAYAKEWYAVLPEAEFYAALSRNLPEWVYIYLPGGQRVSRHTPDGGYSWLPYPVLINQGSTHYFIQPEPASATAAE